MEHSQIVLANSWYLDKVSPCHNCFFMFFLLSPQWSPSPAKLLSSYQGQWGDDDILTQLTSFLYQNKTICSNLESKGCFQKVTILRGPTVSVSLQWSAGGGPHSPGTCTSTRVRCLLQIGSTPWAQCPALMPSAVAPGGGLLVLPGEIVSASSEHSAGSDSPLPTPSRKPWLCQLALEPSLTSPWRPLISSPTLSKNLSGSLATV